MSAAATRYSTRCDFADPGMTRSAHGAVLDAPGRVGRRPEARDQPRIGVHRRSDHGEQFGHQRLLPADEPAHGVGHAHAAPPHRRTRALPSTQSFKRDMQMARLARPVARPFGHEGRHQAATLREDLGEGLEQRALSAARRASSTPIAASSTPGPVSVCRPSISKSIRRAASSKLVIELGMHAGAKHRIAEEAGREVFQIAIAFFSRTECGVSSNRKNSNSAAAETAKPISAALASTRRSTPRGQTASA